ncbi:hypothetical protein DZF91_16060 [Actinomadura logoneensis]|uniref:LppX_LprAFG lipoprotein n=1 Tax=Actinomadura logoneensis TaxID=2293572 RepID=A0A372JLC1_9ACTN|nr:hypothetical protein DZF91_16060 [Actinomadura logoneensis]
MAAGVTSAGAVLLLSGCGGTDTKSGSTGDIKLTAADAVIKASEKTGQADTFKADLTVAGGTGGGSVHATGQFRLRPTLQFNATLDNVSKGGQGLSGLSGQAIFTGDTLYAKVPQQFSQFVGGGKPWVKVSVAQAQQQSGMDVRGVINQIQQVDPAEQTRMFTASKDVRKVGSEKVDGTKTTHYQGTVTVKEALQRLNAQQRADAQKWLDRAGGADRKMNFDLWVDSSNLPRKMVTKGAGSGETGTVTVLYRDYGKSFKVSPPPSDQVGELSLQGLFGKHN